MPKHSVLLKPGDEIPEEFRELLQNKFDEKTIDKLKRFGGRIQLSVTAPFTDRKEQKKSIVIDKILIDRLTSSPTMANEVLSKMTLKQVKEVAKYVKFPIASKTTVEEARRQLISYLFSEETWKKISK